MQMKLRFSAIKNVLLPQKYLRIKDRKLCTFEKARPHVALPSWVLQKEGGEGCEGLCMYGKAEREKELR